MTTDRVAGAVLAAIGLFVIWESLASARRLPLGTLHTPGPAYMPVLLAALLVVFGVVLAVVRGRGKPIGQVSWYEWRHAVAITAVCVFVALALERVGYVVSMTVAIGLLLGAVERKHPVFALGYSVALAVGTFFLFDRALRVPLPRGPLGLWFGI